MKKLFAKLTSLVVCMGFMASSVTFAGLFRLPPEGYLPVTRIEVPSEEQSWAYIDKIIECYRKFGEEEFITKKLEKGILEDPNTYIIFLPWVDLEINEIRFICSFYLLEKGFGILFATKENYEDKMIYTVPTFLDLFLDIDIRDLPLGELLFVE